jgi:hypothetical protein
LGLAAGAGYWGWLRALICRASGIRNPAPMMPAARHATVKLAPHSGPPNDRGTNNIKGMGMTEQQDHAALEREEITTRIASFRATQEKFQRERDAYCSATLEAARAVRGNRHADAELRRRAIDVLDGV